MTQRKRIPAVLALADGTTYEGRAFAAPENGSQIRVGEAVFNTSMYGYQEIMTDPSYAGQIISFAYPHIGNVGVNPEDAESNRIHAEGVVVRNISRVASNFRAKSSLADYLLEANIPGVAEIDTRSLVKHLRSQGAQMAALAWGDAALRPDDLVAQARAAGSMEGKDYVQHVSCKESYSWNQLPWGPGIGYATVSEGKLLPRPHVVAVDCGIKFNILRSLLATGFRVTVVPATATPEQISELQPDALFLSNGPGDPATLHSVVDTVRSLLGRLPLFGICLGHQILAQAVGGKTYKLKFGHRGGNHPVMDLSTRKTEITVQNHGFAVAAESLPEHVCVSHVNLNDQTVEGLVAPEYNAFSVQYHPEAASGPKDASYLFERFYALIMGQFDLKSMQETIRAA